MELESIIVVAFIAACIFVNYQWGFIGRVDDRFSDIESRLSTLEKEEKE